MSRYIFFILAGFSSLGIIFGAINGKDQLLNSGIIFTIIFVVAGVWWWNTHQIFFCSNCGKKWKRSEVKILPCPWAHAEGKKIWQCPQCMIHGMVN